MKRRDFLKTVAGGALGAGLLPSAFEFGSANGGRAFGASEPAPERWLKGNLHAHSQWSDGKDLPEVVIDAYKERGYDFFCLSDHNVIQREELRFDGFAMNFTPQDRTPFANETSFWKKMSAQEGWPNLIDKHLQYARDRFGADSVVTKKTAEGTYVRMKTFAELKARFAEEGKFLLIPGFEMTAQYAHFNLINVDAPFFVENADWNKLVSIAFDKAKELYANQGKPYLFTVNHPLWQYYNIQPSDLIARPDIWQFELNNNSTDYPTIPGAWTPETFWDVVNANRVKRDQHLLYATGTDDSHGIFRTDYIPFTSWMYVRSAELTPDALFDAMNVGKAYTSNGLEFEHIRFDGKTLEVKVKPNKEGEYRIEFIGTKKDADLTSGLVDASAVASCPAHKVESYSEEIGKKLAVFDGLEGSYTLKSDDLYVRAKAYRVGAGLNPIGGDYKPQPLTTDSAWTQPYRDGDSL